VRECLLPQVEIERKKKEVKNKKNSFFFFGVTFSFPWGATTRFLQSEKEKV
jgi:hypothetical protein